MVNDGNTTLETEETSSPETEIEAMYEVAKALGDISQDARQRVLKWAADRFKVSMKLAPVEQPVEAAPGPAHEIATHANNDVPSDFASLFDATNPGSGPERVLVAGYWFQEIEGHNHIEGYLVNRELKNLGYGVANVTTAFSALMNQQPKLAMQVAKSGKSKQARKRYKLTVEGARTVRRMLDNAGP